MNMKEFASLVGLSSYTLRYYEKIGLLKNIQRNSIGHRVYSSKDVQWVAFIKRLKETAMPLDDILAYATLRETGPQTALERQRLLEHHQKHLKQHISQQKMHLAALEEKINLYKANKVR
ncbi:MerR family transcriptional regulator [Pseudoalteromonas xiamenensis]|uniref:MerR family transcriptional regulator n=1 Tax=Pseudoalteromonas xiamenensis TaxID=882626 RepID=A0A975DKB3_9GAMM|nr:MerR family transcriptional regulator [Pseudoalteromonas xiamenensis]QTH73214.1 MerR family transcriptional regulator [Pseudoalteromonas xiamenensis]